jgi:hypothetical protein
MTNRVNLSTNPSIEVSTADHSAIGAATLAQSAVWAQGGTKSLRVTAPSCGRYFRDLFVPDGDQFTITTVIGTTYTASAWVNVDAGYQPMQISAAGVNGSTATGAQRISVTFTATATSTVVKVQGTGAHEGAPAFPFWPTACYIDGILAEAAPVAGTYFDGDSAGCTWSGTSGLSTSTYTAPPPSIDVSADPTASPPRAVIFVNNCSGTTAQIYRTDPNGSQTPVRGGDPATLTSGQWTGSDYEMPYNQGVTYTVVPDDLSTPASAVAAPVESPQPWLIHPGVPALSLPVTGILLTDDQSNSGTALHAPLGRPDPIPVSDGARKTPAFQVSFRTGGEIYSFPGGFTFPGVLTFPGAQDQNDALKAILQDSAPLLLQIVYPFTDITMYRWISIDRVTTARVTMLFGDQQRVWTLDCTEITRPAGGIAAQRTWADLVAECATWQDVIDKYPTWTGVITGIAGT